MDQHPNEPWELELHDAKLTRVEVNGGGQVVLHFSHVTVYKPVGPDASDCWSFVARLRLEETSDLRIAGAFSPRELVIDGHLVMADGTEEPSIRVQSDQPIQSLDLATASGARLTVAAKRLAVELGDGDDMGERWRGDIVYTDYDRHRRSGTTSWEHLVFKRVVDGQTIELLVDIGPARPVSDREWVCEVRIPSIFEAAQSVTGGDAAGARKRARELAAHACTTAPLRG